MPDAAVGLVLDTAALLAYTVQNRQVGEKIAEVADAGEIVLIPATCLASAYRDTDVDGSNLLGVVANLDHVVVTPLEHDHCAILGGWARTLGLDTAHAAIEASGHPVVDLITDKRDLVTAFLPKEWPIIDI